MSKKEDIQARGGNANRYNNRLCGQAVEVPGQVHEGRQIKQGEFTDRGLVGDRAYALWYREPCKLATGCHLPEISRARDHPGLRQRYGVHREIIEAAPFLATADAQG